MKDEQLRRKLNQLRKITNELVDEAQRRYGPEALLFYESGGNFHIMTEDPEGSSDERQACIRFSSEGYCKMDCGSW